MTKTDAGRFFEDFRVGDTIAHATPRTLTHGDRALYTALYPGRHALASSDEFARACGLPTAPMDDLLTFHVVFGKTVPDISVNAVANLGYAEGHFLAPCFHGDTIRAVSEVIGRKQNSNGKSGIVWVRTTGYNQADVAVLSYCRWVMIRKRDAASPPGDTVVPELAQEVAAASLHIPKGLTFDAYDPALAGDPHYWDDYEPGEHIDHVDGVTLTDAEHMMATRLWQNTAKVHFDVSARPDGRRLIYGGHILSMARALSFNGMANAQSVLAINAGTHANPAFAGDTVHAGTTVLEKAATAQASIGALRVRLIAAKSRVSTTDVRDDAGKYRPEVLLDMDLWLALPRR